MKKDELEPIGIRFYRLLSPYPVALFIKLGTSPNSISLTSIAVLASGSILLALGHYWSFVTGAAILSLSFLLDCCDGEVARAINKCTNYGLYLEVLHGYLLYGLTFAGLSIGLYFNVGSSTTLFLGLSAIIFKYLYRVSETLKANLTKGTSWRLSPMRTPRAGLSLARIKWETFMFLFFGGGMNILLLIFAVADRLEWLLAFYGTTMPLIFLIQNFYCYIELTKETQDEKETYRLYS